MRSILAGVLRGVDQPAAAAARRRRPGRRGRGDGQQRPHRRPDPREPRRTRSSDAIADGAFFKMQTFTQALIDARRSTSQVDREVAANAATNRHDFVVALDRAVKAARRRGARRPPRRPPSRREDGRFADSFSRADRETRLAVLAARRPRCVTDGSRARRRLDLLRRLGRPFGAAERVGSERQRPRRSRPSWTVPPAQPVQLSYDAAARRLAERRPGLRRPVERARRDQQDRVELRPEHGPELRRRASAGCSSCRRPGCAGGRTPTANGVRRPLEPGRRGSTRRPATSPRRARATDIRRAVFSYNHAEWYVNEVLQLAQLYGSSDTASADAYQNAAGRRRARVAARRSTRSRPSSTPPGRRSRRQTPQYRTALARRRRSRPSGCAADRRAPTARRSSPTGSTAQKRADAVRRRRRLGPGGGRPAAAASSTTAQAALDELQQQAQAASLQPAGRGAAGGERRRRRLGSYVFPVGGGPAVVSVSHTTTTIRPRTSPRPRARRSTRCPTAPCSTPGAATTALRHRLHDADDRRPDLDVLPPVVPRAVGTQGAAAHRRRRRSGSSARPATPPARTFTCSCSRRPSYPQDQQWFESFAGTAFQLVGSRRPADAGRSARPLVFHIVRVVRLAAVSAQVPAGFRPMNSRE